MNVLYELSLYAYACFALPKMAYRRLVLGKYKDSLWKRFGMGFPDIDKQERPLIWIHAVSMGETKAVAPFARQLKQKYPASMLLISSTTETGHAEAKKSIPEADYHVYLPLDLSVIIKPIVKRVSPNMVILCETDWWYNFLSAAKEGGASVVVVNGKISERSQSRFRFLSSFSHKLFRLIDRFCLQSVHYLERFKDLNIPSDKLIVTGNLKFDAPSTPTPIEELNMWRRQFHLTTEDPVVVIGSSHDGEESQLLDSLEPCLHRHPNLKVLIVPRHPERFDAVAALLAKKGISFSRYSKGEGEGRVILVDAMGVLRKCYEIATVAIVAGSFTDKVGGHNILEPLYYSVPVIFGPHMFSQPELLEMVKACDAGIQSSIAQVGDNVNRLLENPALRRDIGKRGLQLIRENLGATTRTLEAVSCFFSK